MERDLVCSLHSAGRWELYHNWVGWVLFTRGREFVALDRMHLTEYKSTCITEIPLKQTISTFRSN